MKEVVFYFEGKRIQAYEGESIAAALYAVGLKTFTWSYKRKRPRGWFCGIGKCSSCLMIVDEIPNVRTCIVPVKDGLKVQRQEQGLGTLPSILKEDPEEEKLDVELAVIGGGPAGLSSAIMAKKLGCTAIVIDENFKPGGQLIKQTHKFFGSKENYAGIRGIEIAKILLKDLKELGGSWLLSSTVAADYLEGKKHVLLVPSLIEPKIRVIRADRVIVGTGARENMLIFPNNDLPGVYGAGGVQTLMNVFGVKPGDRALVVGAGNVGLIIAYQLIQAGTSVEAIVEAMPRVGGYFVHAAKVRRLGVPIYLRHSIKRAIGGEFVEAAEIVQLDEKWNPIEGTERRIEVDTIVLAVGLTPASEIPAQAGCKLAYIPELGGQVAIHDQDLRTTLPGMYVAGDSSGIEEATTAMLEGKIAGADAASSLGYKPDEAERIKEKAKRDILEFRESPFGEKPRRGKEKIWSIMEAIS
ncbi:MAG TPA: sarcosine oxidase subunit alpha [Candidatus Korarchaeota archaeon]|nr:sarcosine oxidase subunit alpha [Candidatus Korarchaeota archaeon]